MKQSAVEFAVEKLAQFIPSGNQLVIHIILEKAKEIEKQQIIDAQENGQAMYSNVIRCDKSKQYYNETFKNK